MPALRTHGTLALLDAKLTGRSGAAKLPAIINYNGKRLLLRDITSAGYGRALGDVKAPDFAAAFRVKGTDKPGSEGLDIAEHFSQTPTSLFPTSVRSLRRPVMETPDTPWDDPKSWANVDDFGAGPTGRADSAAGGVHRAFREHSRRRKLLIRPPNPDSLTRAPSP